MNKLFGPSYKIQRLGPDGSFLTVKTADTKQEAGRLYSLLQAKYREYHAYYGYRPCAFYELQVLGPDGLTAKLYGAEGK